MNSSTEYALSADVLLSTGQAAGGEVQVYLFWFDASGVWTGGSDFVSTQIAGSWQHLEKTGTSPGNVAGAQVMLRMCKPDASPFAVQWDNVVLWSTPVAGVIPAEQRQVLLDLYNSTVGPGWWNHTGWAGPIGTECTWYGITCDVGGNNVSSISLWNNRLQGSLPPSLSGLTSLREFAVFSNELTGSIPSLTGLTSLQSFWVEDNQLTGSIPSLTGLTSLESLWVSDNQLSGTLPDVSGLGLVELEVRGNSFTGNIPSSYGGLSSLTYLDLRWNGLYSTDPVLVSFLNSKQTGVTGSPRRRSPRAMWPLRRFRPAR